MKCKENITTHFYIQSGHSANIRHNKQHLIKKRHKKQCDDQTHQDQMISLDGLVST